MDTNGINQLLAEMQRAQALAQGKPAAAEAPQGAGQVDFASVLDSALKGVSEAQGQAQQQADQFAAGDPNVDLQNVMIDLEKASLAFNQMVQVRNRLVSAYQDIMNMPV
ncbi:flagellar hook-basal body complex protein FliE [Tepidiphilus margaritifer]|uniref:flagellar hook-basal body complex protein FliE n=1 Tax=Tepidiphilus margaritifer TaxID=203471 RepID=UPI000402BD9E|nr:flagellar hook-basal body complex protein FliE [Tepidiphilus margaritifer]